MQWGCARIHPCVLPCRRAKSFSAHLFINCKGSKSDSIRCVLTQWHNQAICFHSSLTIGRWRPRKKLCSPSCLPWASGQTCLGWCWTGSRHREGNTGAGPSGTWSTSSAAPARLPYPPAKTVTRMLWVKLENKETKTKMTAGKHNSENGVPKKTRKKKKNHTAGFLQRFSAPRALLALILI